MRMRIVSAVMLLGFVVYMSGCETKAQTGTAVGAGVGAVAGQAIGRDTKSTLIGAGAGAVGGYMIGNEQDKAQMRAQQATVAEQANTYIVNITNSNGSITPVTLRRMGNVWVGPRGEQYTTPPTAEQLRPIYGF